MNSKLKAALWVTAQIAISEEAIATKREFCYDVATVPEETVTYFDRVQRRCDIIITGSNVTVDKEIKSNGGTVIIFADSVRINAPIDTRPYDVLP